MTAVPVAALEALYLAVARRFGADDAEARAFADARLVADLRGRDTQGAATLRMEFDWLKAGATRFGAPFRIVRETGATILADAGGSVGAVAATRAMDLAIDRALAGGMCGVWLRNTNDFFAASSYALRAVDRDCIGIAMSNSPAFVSAWGGREPLLGTNPIAIAVPGGDEAPIVVDMSTSSLSHGQVVMAAREGRMLAEAVLVDEDGRVGNDPRRSVVDPKDRNSAQRGSILPPGAKGFGWMLFVEIFTGLLSGMSLSRDVDLDPTAEAPSRIGQCFIAVHVGALMPPETFRSQADRLVRSILDSTPIDGFGAVMSPGAAAARCAESRRREGVPVSAEVLRQIASIAEEIGFPRSALIVS